MPHHRSVAGRCRNLSMRVPHNRYLAERNFCLWQEHLVSLPKGRWCDLCWCRPMRVAEFSCSIHVGAGCLAPSTGGLPARCCMAVCTNGLRRQHFCCMAFCEKKVAWEACPHRVAWQMLGDSSMMCRPLSQTNVVHFGKPHSVTDFMS